MKNKLIVLTLSLMVLLSACGPSQKAIQAAVNQTLTAKESEQPTRRPSFTPRPSRTPKPEVTNTPYYTKTPSPTNTPTITATPKPIAEPVVFSGSGDDIVELKWSYGPAIVEIVGNPASRHFAVQSFDKNNEPIDLLVNTTDPYFGTLLINMDDEVARFVVTAKGEWEINVKDFREMRTADVPGSINGIGDDVFIVLGNKCDTAIIQGNAESRHFAVVAYYLPGYADLLVNTTEPYEGKVLCPKETLVFEVTASGEWIIEFPS